MDSNYFVEFISEDLDFKYECKFFSLPSIGKKIWIDDKQFEVCDVQLFFYSKMCQNNKVRVYVRELEDY
jgi:hypothetical protein